MNSTLKKLSTVLAEMSVEVPASDVDASLNKAYHKLGRTAQVRGFRKGKVPVHVVKRMFGEAVLADVATELVSEHSEAAFKEQDVFPISQPEVDLEPLKEKEDFKFTVKFELRPKLEKINFDGIEVNKYRVEVKPERVQEELERLRSSMAEVVDLDEPRPVEKNDLAKINLRRWVDGDWEEQSIPEQEIVVGEGKYMAELEDGLVGLKPGDEKAIDLGKEEGSEEERKLLVTVVSVHERRLPELDDEFAKDLGDFDTLDALKADIEDRIRKGAEAADKERMKHDLFEALREKNDFELPPSLVQRQSQALQMQLLNQFGMMGQLDKKDGEEDPMAKLTEGAEKTAREMVQQHLLLLELARLQELEVGDEEIDAEIATMANSRGVPVPMLRAEYQKDDRREELRHSLLERKVFDFAQGQVKITEMDPPEPETKEAEAE